jgi:hypothetical protein
VIHCTSKRFQVDTIQLLLNPEKHSLTRKAPGASQWAPLPDCSGETGGPEDHGVENHSRCLYADWHCIPPEYPQQVSAKDNSLAEYGAREMSRPLA